MGLLRSIFGQAVVATFTILILVLAVVMLAPIVGFCAVLWLMGKALFLA